MSKSKKLLGNMKNRIEKNYDNLMNKLSGHKKIVYLYNQNFKNGSVIIDKDWYLITDNDGKSTKIMGSTNGIKFKLSENITFNPNSIKDTARDANFPTAMEITLAGRVKKSQHDVYDQRAFGIGFFSALIIQASNITIDLNGYKIEQSFEHALQQRFFSVIELASIPFYQLKVHIHLVLQLKQQIDA